MGLECRRMAVRDVALPYGLSSNEVPRFLVTSSAVPLQSPSPGSSSSSRKPHPAHLHLHRNTLGLSPLFLVCATPLAAVAYLGGH